MPSLKDYIRTLFERSCGQAMPASGGKVFCEPIVTGTWSEHVAPFDGYFCVYTYGGATVTLLEVSNKANDLMVKSAGNAQYSGGYVLCKRGDTVRYNISTSGTPSAGAFFIPAVGAA